ncbi:UPF0235 protein C15orf40 homolog [Microplitis mediator]|uniref:UPF0235 protein C15orf40 homolog n=1 Tax=Microplitis mediator TaxID=375433 RepID=UPI002555398B|nr:UPF0235 protein C15orf40 homolog [Microplitis mediator]
MFSLIGNILVKKIDIRQTKFTVSVMSKKFSKKPSQHLQEKKADLQVGPVSVDKDGNVILRIQAKPGAKRSQITDFNEEAISVAISSPPVDGQANIELVKYLSSVLDVKKSSITLDKGCRSRHKTVIIIGSTPSIITEKIMEEIKNYS